MQTTTKCYTDIDYESFPIADLTLDRHWIQLPTAVLLERQKARRAAQHQARLAALPEDHKIILVPADPTYSPLEEELWPLINGTIHQTLQPHPDVFAKVVAAVDHISRRSTEVVLPDGQLAAPRRLGLGLGAGRSASRPD